VVWGTVAAKEMANVGRAVVGGALAAAVVTWAAAKQLTINRGGAVVVKIVAAAGSMQMIKVATSTAGGLAVVASATAISVTRHWVIRGAAAVGVTSVEVVTVTSIIWPTAMVVAKNKMNVSGQAGRGCVMVETVVV
jgi:hypothetical protein